GGQQFAQPLMRHSAEQAHALAQSVPADETPQPAAALPIAGHQTDKRRSPAVQLAQNLSRKPRALLGYQPPSKQYQRLVGLNAQLSASLCAEVRPERPALRVDICCTDLDAIGCRAALGHPTAKMLRADDMQVQQLLVFDRGAREAATAPLLLLHMQIV